MNPVVEAAWIAGASGLVGVVVGVGGTVTVGIVGFRSTRKATVDTLKAAHDDKVYEKRAAVYVDALTMTTYAQPSFGSAGGRNSKEVTRGQPQRRLSGRNIKRC